MLELQLCVSENSLGNLEGWFKHCASSIPKGKFSCVHDNGTSTCSFMRLREDKPADDKLIEFSVKDFYKEFRKECEEVLGKYCIKYDENGEPILNPMEHLMYLEDESNIENIEKWFAEYWEAKKYPKKDGEQSWFRLEVLGYYKAKKLTIMSTADWKLNKQFHGDTYKNIFAEVRGFLAEFKDLDYPDDAQ